MTCFFSYFRFKSCRYLNDFLSFLYLLRIQRIKDKRLLNSVSFVFLSFIYHVPKFGAYTCFNE